MNLFLVRAGRLITPDVSQGILEGLTRDSVMTLARQELQIATEQRPVDRTELYVADEVFLCGTAAQIAPVTCVDGRNVGNGVPGAVTVKLQREYDRAVRGKSPGYTHWVHPVYGSVNAGSISTH